MVRPRCNITKSWFSLLLMPAVVGGLLMAMGTAPDRTVLRAAEPSAAADPHGAGATTIHLPLVPNGFAFTSYLPFVAAQFRPYQSVLGVHMAAVTDAQGRQQAVGAGVEWVRTLTFAWDLIEPARTSPPTYRWSYVDEAGLVNAANSGFTYIGVVHFTPPWAQALPGVACGPIRQDALGKFAQFLTALAARYSRPPYNVHHWELWNEPDVDPSVVDPRSPFGCWGDEDDPYYGGGYFSLMLRFAYPALKAGDPQAEVLVGGLLLDCDPRDPPDGKTCKSSKFLEGILRAGGGQYFDMVAFHAYSYGNLQVPGAMGNPNWPGSVTAIPEKVSYLRGLLSQYGAGDRVLVNTEAALLCAGPTNACLETQAAYVPRAYAEALSLELRAQIYYPLVDDGWYNAGLLSPDLTAKPAYRAYAAAAQFLGSARYVGQASGYPDGIDGYAFNRPDSDESIDVIWSSDGSAVSVPLPAGVHAYDRNGTLIGVAGPIEVDYSPVYVVRPH